VSVTLERTGGPSEATRSVQRMSEQRVVTGSMVSGEGD